MRKDSRAAAPNAADFMTSLVHEILDRTDRCVRIWKSNGIEVVGTDHRNVDDVKQTIDCLLRPVPRAEAEVRLRSVISCREKRPKLVNKLKLVAAALEGDHPRARLKSKRHKAELKMLLDELRGGLLTSVLRLFEAEGRNDRMTAPLGTSRVVVRGVQTPRSTSV